MIDECVLSGYVLGDYVHLVNLVNCELGEFGEYVMIWMCTIVTLYFYTWGSNNCGVVVNDFLLSVINNVKLIMLFYYHLIMLLFVESNPQWSFGWPSVLFLWMGR